MKNFFTDTPMVTVVMAVYNSERTLSDAIDSVRAQTYDKWTLICVNDGSTDGSLDILKKYSLIDKRISYINKKNEGAAAARACAYRKVTTPYVIFLDSDDRFSDDLLFNVIDCAYRTDADAIAPNFLSQHSDNSFSDWNKDNNLQIGQTMTGEDAFKRLFICPSMHGCNLWKTELIKKFATCDEIVHYSMNADEYIQRLLFLNCKKVVISRGTYIYNYNSDSTTKKFSIKHLGYLDTCKKYLELIDQYSIDEDTASIIKEYYFRHIIHLQIRYFESYDLLKCFERGEIKKKLKEAYKDAIQYKKYIHFSEKKNGWLYKSLSVTNYYLFLLICKISSKFR